MATKATPTCFAKRLPLFLLAFPLHSTDLSIPATATLLSLALASRQPAHFCFFTQPLAPTILVFHHAVRSLSWLLLAARGLAQGNPLFYAYTKKDTRNSDMVVHTANRRAARMGGHVD